MEQPQTDDEDGDDEKTYDAISNAQTSEDMPIWPAAQLPGISAELVSIHVKTTHNLNLLMQTPINQYTKT